MDGKKTFYWDFSKKGGQMPNRNKLLTFFEQYGKVEELKVIPDKDKGKVVFTSFFEIRIIPNKSRVLRMIKDDMDPKNQFYVNKAMPKRSKHRGGGTSSFGHRPFNDKPRKVFAKGKIDAEDDNPFVAAHNSNINEKTLPDGNKIYYANRTENRFNSTGFANSHIDSQSQQLVGSGMNSNDFKPNDFKNDDSSRYRDNSSFAGDFRSNEKTGDFRGNNSIDWDGSSSGVKKDNVSNNTIIDWEGSSSVKKDGFDSHTSTPQRPSIDLDDFTPKKTNVNVNNDLPNQFNKMTIDNWGS